jgi:type II secretory pathway component GspD/PulD (secretin)
MYGYKNLKTVIAVRKVIFFICTFVLILMVAIAVTGVEQNTAASNPAANADAAGAQVQVDAPQKSVPQNEASAPIASVAESQVSRDASLVAKKQTIYFKKDLPKRDALNFLGTRYQKNIVPSAKVDGLITVTNLYDVTFEEALVAILGPTLKYEQKDNFIMVYNADEYKQIKEDKSRMTHRVFTLFYITAKEAEGLITPVLSGQGLIKSSTPAKSEISGGASSVGSGSSGGGGGDTMALHDMVVVYDYPENVEKAAEVIKSIDVRPKQVLVEATILSAVLTEETKFGIDWNFFNGVNLIGTAATSDIITDTAYNRGSTSTAPIAQIASGGAGTPIETAGFATTGDNGLRIGVTSGNLAAFITALERTTDVTILANPKILAINKQEGMLHVGKTLGYRGSTTISTGGVATQGEDKFLDSGTKLVFRPYIGGDGYIRMDIHPEDSTAQLNVDKVPDKTTAEVKTNILVKDGETIVIGGLFRDVVTTGRSQVPILGDLPLAGALFRGTADKTERQEVMILLTPHIIKEPNETEGQARAADIGRKRSAAKEELQWIDRTRLAEDSYARAVNYYLDGDSESAMKQLAVAFNLRPTYLEAIRLKERIITEATPEDMSKLERIMLEAIDKQEAGTWMRK